MDYSILKQQILDDIKSDPIAKSNSKALGYMIQNNVASYKTAADYSKILGDVVSKNINKNIPDGVPDEELSEFASSCLTPVYRQSQETMLNACKKVQKVYNNEANIGLNPAEVERDESRIQNIQKRFDEAETYDDVSFLTNENVARSITRGVVNDSIRKNSKMQSDAGLKIRISRSDGSGCCQWCSGLVGDYDSFDKLPADFWKIHRNCNCIIDYNVGKTNQKIKYKTDKNGNLEKANEQKTWEYNLQFFAKRTKARKVPKDTPLWDFLVQGDIEKQRREGIFGVEFGGKYYMVEFNEDYAYNILSETKVPNIHDKTIE